MDANIYDLVKETTSTAGTGTLTLSASTGFARFADVAADTELVYYVIINGDNKEIGIGTVGASNTLARTTPLTTVVGATYDNTTPTAITLVGTSTVSIAPTAAAVVDAANDAPGTETLIVAIGDESTAITTGTAKVTFRMPYAFTLTSVKASLTVTSSSGIPTFDINEAGTTVLSTKLTIDASELTSATAATAAVISDSALADDAEITIDVDVAGTGAAGAKIYLIGTQA